ncbi:MAG: UPF0147 family protein [Candidatus Bilamarchaeaceae archaeon]
MEIAQIVGMLENVIDDSSVPKNIRKKLSEARDRLNGSDDATVKVSAAIYLIDSVSEDINMPPNARTQIWAIMSSLESMKK